MDLFGQDLLDAETHKAVFGELPSTLVSELRTPEVGDLVLQLLDAGWRRGQLAARVGALPSGPDPVGGITALLRGFLDQLPPDARWREERVVREAERSRSEAEQPASEQARQEWVARIRAELSAPRQPRPVPRRRARPACALCGQESAFFVTREVRLCEECVSRLGSVAARTARQGQRAG